MRNEVMEQLDVLVGSWRTALRNAAFLEPPGLQVPGDATVEWLRDAFLVFRWTMTDDAGKDASEMVLVLGRSDAPRLVHRALPRRTGRLPASDDRGATWRKDFDLMLDRA